MLKVIGTTIALLASIGLAGNANAIPRYRAPGTLATPIKNVFYSSLSSSFPTVSYTDSGVLGVQTRFNTGVSAAAINYPTPNTAYFGGTTRSLTAQFASSDGQCAIEVGVMKGVAPSAAINNWIHVDSLAANAPKQSYTGYYIRYTTGGSQWEIYPSTIPMPSAQAGTYHQVRVYRIAGNGWNVNIWNVATGSTILNTNLGAASCLNASGQYYTPTFVHNAYAGSQINSSDPAINQTNTWDSSQLRYENLGHWQANNVFSGYLPNSSAHHDSGWLGSRITAYTFNPAMNSVTNRLMVPGLGANGLPNPNITPIPVSNPVPCGPGTSIPACPGNF